MLATVRNRRGMVTVVDPFDSPTEGRLHLVTIEYTDSDGVQEDRLVWERESKARLLEPTALPDPSADNAMDPAEFDALVRATRWGALTPFTDPDGDGPLTRLPIASPFHGAIQVEDFQLVPLLKALRMPRVSLMLAEDVGLGKTIEAGLILNELLLRRRIRRVLVICPASLRVQWKQEMKEKFSLPFDVVDLKETQALRKRLGLDANPWRTFPRIITSYHYLKQPDVLDQFIAACRMPEGSPHLPWDLLIVDEAHNLAPASWGEDSDLSKMLGLLVPYFEHRLFLTATPHNGHTRSFSGLLERLDPVRFSRTNEFSPAERARVEDVVIRRLKREINARTNPPPFCERRLEAITINLGREERALSSAFQEFRTKVRSVVASMSKGEERAGAFAVEVLGKRLLSCPVAFADSWQRYQDGLKESEGAEANEVYAAERATQEETGDDREAESRTAHAARTVGAWLRPLATKLESESKAIGTALKKLGLDQADPIAVDPAHDARFAALCKWIDEHLRTPKQKWRDDERLVIFTEYKTTLDSLVRRLRVRYPEPDVIRELYGGMDDHAREAIKGAFNDPADPVRVLVATDAASEGLNLQETARFLLHFDVPWNPARLEQRNGRLDRHGQERDVVVHHFVTNDDADLEFLAYIVTKVDTIREDLGATEEVFDAAFQRRFLGGEAKGAVEVDLNRALEIARERIDVPHDGRTSTAETGKDELARLRALGEELDLDPGTLRDTLEVALGIGYGRPRFEAPDARGRVRLRMPVPPGWEALVDDSLRLEGHREGALPSLVFDPLHFVQIKGGRPVFRPVRDTALLHLGHPLLHRALACFARARFPGGDKAATRWTVRRGPVPKGAEALLLVTVEELAVNELRERFHHWVRTWQIPVKDGLGEPLPHAPAAGFRLVTKGLAAADVKAARDVWSGVFVELRRFLEKRADDLTRSLVAALAQERTEATKREQERFQSRQGELSKLMEQQTLDRLEREVAKIESELKQSTLFDREQRIAELARSRASKDEEIKRRRGHVEELREQLGRERTRILEHLLPKRHAMRGPARVFPVAIEIRLGGGSR